jgi:hypothetical protein
MSDYSAFTAQIAEWMNRQDFSDNLLASFVSMANAKFNAELRVSRMIQTDTALIAGRCAPLPDDWLEMSLVQIASPNAPSGWTPIRYKSRDEFFNLPDKWAQNFYTIEGRQIYFGGCPDDVNGIQYQISYFGEVPVFSDTQDSWLFTKYPSLYLSAALMHAYMHAVGEEAQAAGAKQLTEDGIEKLNNEWRLSKASGSRITRTRLRSFG